MVEFVNNALKTDVQFKLTFQQLLKTNLMVVGILVGFVLGVYLCYNVLLIQWIWLAIACTVWVISSGGVIHNKVMNPQPYGSYFDEAMNKTVITEYFTREYSGAYSREGYMVESGLWIFSLTLGLLINLPKMIENRFVLRVLMVFLGFGIILMHAQFMEIIRIKMPWFYP